MFKHLISIGTPLMVLLLTTQSVFADAAMQSVDIDVPNSYDINLGERLETLENCQSSSVNVFFRNGYIEFHSAEIMNEALSAVSKCNIEDVRITLFESQPDFQHKLAVRAEIVAFMKAHDLIAFSTYHVDDTQYDAHGTRKANLILNGLSAEIHFDLDKDAQNDQS